MDKCKNCGHDIIRTEAFAVRQPLILMLTKLEWLHFTDLLPNGNTATPSCLEPDCKCANAQPKKV